MAISLSIHEPVPVTRAILPSNLNSVFPLSCDFFNRVRQQQQKSLLSCSE